MKRKDIKKERSAQYKLLRSIKRLPENYPNSWSELTHAQKAHIYRKMKEYSHVLQSSGLFVARRVMSEKTTAKLKEAGFDIKNGIVLVRRESALDTVTVSDRAVTIMRRDGSYTKFQLGSKKAASNLILPKMKGRERIGLNLGECNTNGSRNVAEHQKNYAVPSGAVSRDGAGNSVFTGNGGDNMRVYGWVISTLETGKQLFDKEYERESVIATRKMRVNFQIGR